MTSEEIAQSIMNKFHRAIKDQRGTQNETGDTGNKVPKLIFEMSNSPHTNGDGVLDSFQLSKKQILEVIAICTNDPVEENKEEIADIIVKNHVNEDLPLFLVAFYEYVAQQ